jgi:hypothetical protein
VHPIGHVTRALGMTTAAWMSLPGVLLEVASLVATQTIEPDLWPEPRPNPIASGDSLPHVVQLGGVPYIEDGHHRWARARRRGDLWIACRLLMVASPPVLTSRGVEVTAPIQAPT